VHRVLAGACANLQNGTWLFEKCSQFFQNRRFIVLAGLGKRLVLLHARPFERG
jgi:hypothetical protein